MKNLLLILSIFLVFTSFSQLIYHYDPWVIDQTQIMLNGEVDTLEYDFNQDGIKDMRISSWSNHQDGIQTVVEVLMINSNPSGKWLELINGSGYISDCPSSGFVLNPPYYPPINFGYIYTSNELPSPYVNEVVNMPFRIQDNSLEIHYGLIRISYQSTMITIMGYIYNQTPNSPVDCNLVNLSVSEFDKEIDLEIDKYFNLLGQEIKDPHGFVIVLYKNGITKKIYIE